VTTASLAILQDHYTLLDKGVMSISAQGADHVIMIFSLFHCDDPVRNDEGNEYRLTVVFNMTDIRLESGSLFHSPPRYFGEVLLAEDIDGFLRLGIEWTDLESRATTWTSLILAGDPVDLIEETITL
jgi:hypothetical protein